MKNTHHIHLKCLFSAKKSSEGSLILWILAITPDYIHWYNFNEDICTSGCPIQLSSGYLREQWVFISAVYQSISLLQNFKLYQLVKIKRGPGKTQTSRSTAFWKRLWTRSHDQSLLRKLPQACLWSYFQKCSRVHVFTLDFVMNKKIPLIYILRCIWQVLFFKPVVQTERLHLNLEMGFTASKTSVKLFRHQNNNKKSRSDKTPGDMLFRSYTYSTVLMLSLVHKLYPKKYIW